jgi:hypothetical protein
MRVWESCPKKLSIFNSTNIIFQKCSDADYHYLYSISMCIRFVDEFGPKV